MEGGRAPRTITIRWSLIRNLVLLIAVLTGSILFGIAWLEEEVARSTSEALIGRALHATTGQLRSFFDPVQRGLRFASDLVASGSLDVDDPPSLNRVFIPLIEEIPQISSINVGDERGYGYLLLRGEDRWRNRVTRVDEWGDRLEFAEWRDEQSPLESWVVERPDEDQRYDPRSRDWYRLGSALEGEGGAPAPIAWTEPYTFFTEREPGITATTRVRDPAGRSVVLAFDVRLRDLSEFTRRLEVSEHGFAAVLDEAGGVVGLPRSPRFEDPARRAEALLRRPLDLGVPELHDGALAWRALLPDPPATFSFESGGRSHWADLEPFPLGSNRTFSVVVVVPESDLLGPLERFRLGIVGVAALSFAGAVAMALLLARSYARPLTRLARNSQRLGTLDLGPVEPVASVLREVEQLAVEQERTRVALDSFARYVPLEVIRELMVRGEAARIGGSRRHVTVLFTDIEGFTSVAESMSPERLTHTLADYFEVLLGTLQGDGFGTVTQLSGDGVVAFWGAPIADEGHAEHAAAAVVAARRRLAELDAARVASGAPALPTRFGLAAGPVVVGNVGAPSRLVYTAVGDTINLASRLEGLNRFYGTKVLVSGAVRRAAGAAFAWRQVDVVRVKGKARAEEIHELLGAAGEVDPGQIAFARRYEAALALHRERHFAEALAHLDELARERPGDASIERLSERSRRFAATPPGPDWDGVMDYFEK